MAPISIDSHNSTRAIDVVSLVPLSKPGDSDFRRLLETGGSSSTDPIPEPARSDDPSSRSASASHDQPDQPESSAPVADESSTPEDKASSEIAEQVEASEQEDLAANVDPALVANPSATADPQDHQTPDDPDALVACHAEECDAATDVEPLTTGADAESLDAAQDIEAELDSVPQEAPADEAVPGKKQIKNKKTAEASEKATPVSNEDATAPVAADTEAVEEKPQAVTNPEKPETSPESKPEQKQATSASNKPQVEAPVTEDVQEEVPVASVAEPTVEDAPVEISTRPHPGELKKQAGTEQKDEATADESAGLKVDEAAAEDALAAEPEESGDGTRETKTRRGSRHRDDKQVRPAGHTAQAAATNIPSPAHRAATSATTPAPDATTPVEGADTPDQPQVAAAVAVSVPAAEKVEIATKPQQPAPVAERKSEGGVAPIGSSAGSETGSEGGLAERFAKGLGAAQSTEDKLGTSQRLQLIQRVAKAFQRVQVGEGPVRLRLTPPELGTLRIELRMRDGALSAKLEAETSAARSALLDNLPQLKSRLAEHDIHVEQFDVELLDQQGEQTPQQQGDHADNSREPWQTSPRRAAGGPRSNSSETTSQPAPRTSSGIGSGQLDVVV